MKFKTAGDVIASSEILGLLDKFDLSQFSQILWLSGVSREAILTPETLLPQHAELLQSLRNETRICPYLDKPYQTVLPVAILSNNISDIKAFVPPSLQYEDFLEFTAKMLKDELEQMSEERQPADIFSLGSIEAILLGTGYDHGRLSYDGSRLWEWAVIQADPHALLCAVLVWYNR